MKNDILAPKFFLSANTAEGFFSVFNHLYYPESNWFCYILKGGPGTGKSTLMKKISKKAHEKKIKAELIHCSSDPDSLDAVILPDLKIAIADGTSPHTLDPIYPGVSDIIVNLGECWNENGLAKHKNEIINLSKEISELHKKSKKYLQAFKTTYNEIENIILYSTDFNAVNDYCDRFVKKLFNKKQKNKTNRGFEQLRLISSITPSGYLFFDNTIMNLSNEIFIVEDKYHATGSYILNKIKEYALNLGYDVISCPSPFSPSHQMDALFISELKVCFAVKQNIKNIDIFKSYKKITTKRFLNTSKIANNKNLISFNQKICNELLEESIKNLASALKIHDELEEIYKSNMNYEKINKITDKLISAIFKF